MNIKRLFFFSTGISLILFASSCATTYPNEKLITGTWNPVTVENYDPPAKTPKQKKSPSDTLKSKKSVPKPIKAVSDLDTNLEIQRDRMVHTELRSPITVYPNKTVIKFYPGKTAKGTWKMKKKGTRIIAKESSTNKKIILDILEISETSATVIERFPFGDIRIVYTKQK